MLEVAIRALKQSISTKLHALLLGSGWAGICVQLAGHRSRRSEGLRGVVWKREQRVTKWHHIQEYWNSCDTKGRMHTASRSIGARRVLSSPLSCDTVQDQHCSCATGTLGRLPGRNALQPMIIHSRRFADGHLARAFVETVLA